MSEDVVNHPSHYAEGWSNGAEVIDITENLNFNRGNAVKYIARAGKKNPEKELEDLQKAEFYLKREIQRIAQRWDNPPTYQVVAEPRVWESLYDVPINVKVTDKSDDVWDWRRQIGPGLGKWGFSREGSSWNAGNYGSSEELRSWDHYGPFTEVLEGSE